MPVLDIKPKHLDILKALLAKYVPHAEVWAYGSRVTGDGHEASDIDIVLRSPSDITACAANLSELKEAVIESDLPIHVDITDWAKLPEAFRHEIEKAYCVIQAG